MPCKHLEYRERDSDHAFDHDRPWCAVQEAFVSPMRADVCNDRFDFSHDRHCEVFRRARQADSRSPEASTD